MYVWLDMCVVAHDCTRRGMALVVCTAHVHSVSSEVLLAIVGLRPETGWTGAQMSHQKSTPPQVICLVS